MKKNKRTHITLHPGYDNAHQLAGLEVDNALIMESQANP